MWRVLLTLILLVGFSLPIQASPTQVVAPEYGECRDMNGKPVRYVGVSNTTFRRMGIRAAFATTVTKGRYVIYNRDTLAMMPYQFQQMVLWHECGHYKLGHLHPAAFSNNPRIAYQREKEADCFSGVIMKSLLGYSENDIKVAINTLKSLSKNFMGSGITHDTPNDRAKIVEYCAK